MKIIARSLIYSALAFFVVFRLDASAVDCSRPAGSLPDPGMPAGTVNPAIPIEHIVVIMQENHSFDNYFGRLNQPEFYGNQVDGVTPDLANPDTSGEAVHVFHENNLCIADPHHDWNAEHQDWDEGKNDGFVTKNDGRVMGFYDQTDIPFYYGLANQFAIGDRYFCSVLSQTFPNRFFLLAGTAFGHIKNDTPKKADQFDQATIFDVLTQYRVSWKYYTDSQGYLALFQPMYERNLEKIAKLKDFDIDLEQGTLPQVVFIDSDYEVSEDEHPNANVQLGQAWVAERVRSLVGSPYWKDSALFFTYDENGGFYDHVSPPEACAPDGIAPHLNSSSEPGAYDRYGFRVPFVAVSPFAKHHYVSHVTYDHTSILKFIETKFNLPALTARDANADGMLDLFDFAHPVLEVSLPSSDLDPERKCENGSEVQFDLGRLID